MADNETTEVQTETPAEVPVSLNDLKDVNNRVAVLEGEIKTLSTDFNQFLSAVKGGNFIGAIVSAEQFKSAVSEVIEEASDDAKEVKTTVADNTSRIAKVENDLSAIRSDVATALTDIQHFRLNRLGADANKVLGDVNTTEVDGAELLAAVKGR